MQILKDKVHMTFDFCDVALQISFAIADVEGLTTLHHQIDNYTLCMKDYTLKKHKKVSCVVRPHLRVFKNRISKISDIRNLDSRF